MTTTDELLTANATFARSFDQGGLAAAPSRNVAVVVCMDARLDVYRLAGINLGEAHVIRNAGGVVTEDVVRSLVISQRELGTTEIVLVHHSGCGMTSFSDDEAKAQILAETGQRPPFALEAFDDVPGDVRQSIARVKASPFIPHKNVRGFVYDVETGELNEVTA